MLMFVPKTEQYNNLSENELIALMRGYECFAYCRLLIKLNQIVILHFDEEMTDKLIEKYGKNIPFDFKVLGA